jgi:glycyl-tRNA synthetase beta chain
LNNIYLLEIGCEEIPARFMRPLLNNVQSLMSTLVTNARLDYKNIKVMGTYRRLAIFIEGMGAGQKDLQELIKGPPAQIALNADGSYTQAALGFAKKLNVATTELVIQETENGKYVFANKLQKGERATDILPKIIDKLLSSIDLPIAMRWGNQEKAFIRPVHWLLSLFNNQIVPLNFFAITAANYSYGHRFLTHNLKDEEYASGVKIAIKHSSDYLEILKKNYVIVNQDERQTLIEKWLSKSNQQKNIDQELVEEVTFLTEYPTMLTGTYHKDYLNLPEQVLIHCMKKHQKYFPVFKNKSLTANFCFAADNVTKSNQKIIIEGNENVLRARLEDVLFFWQEDIKTRLETRVTSLKTIVYQKGLGSIYAKVQRMQQLGVLIAEKLELSKYQALIKRTIDLCKTDLSSHMVYELPNLQGTMGMLYALAQKEDKLVAQGIEDHYKPRFQNDSLPTTPTGMVVAMADRIDTIVGSFYNNQIPTGSQDPLGIRRAISGVLQIIYANKFHLDVLVLFEAAYATLSSGKNNEDKLKTFFLQRVRSFMLDLDINYDLVDTVTAIIPFDLICYIEIAQALDSLRTTKINTFKLLTDSAVRVKRLIKNDLLDKPVIDEQIFAEKIELKAWQTYKTINSSFSNSINKNDYLQAMKSLIPLCQDLTTYFDDVLVMHKDEKLKANRLAFLNSIHLLFSQFGDFEKIVI